MPPLSIVGDRLEPSQVSGGMGRFSLMCGYIGCTGLCRRGRTSSLRRSRSRLLHLAVEFRFTIDAANYELGLDVKCPFYITVREDLRYVPGRDRCRVNYHCDFGLPAAWRDIVARFLMRREVKSGPVDSLSRLRRAAEKRYGASTRNSMIRGSTHSMKAQSQPRPSPSRSASVGRLPCIVSVISGA
jgi:hypothetical protein